MTMEKVRTLIFPSVFPSTVYIDAILKIQPMQHRIFFRICPSYVIQHCLFQRIFAELSTTNYFFHHVQVICKKAVGQVAIVKDIDIPHLAVFRSIAAVNHDAIPVYFLFRWDNIYQVSPFYLLPNRIQQIRGEQ